MTENLPAIVIDSRTEIEARIPALIVSEIQSPQGATYAALCLREIKGMTKDWGALRKQLTTPLDERKREVMDYFKPVEQRLVEAEQTLKKAILDWEAERVRIRDEEIKARTVAAAEAEARAKALLEAEKQAVLEEWDFEEAQAIEIEQASLNVPVVMPSEIKNHSAGISTPVIWKYEIVDFSLLPDEFKLPDSSKLNSIVKKHHENTNVPGVRVYSEKTVSARA